MDAAQTYYIINYNKNFYPTLQRLNLVVATIFSFYGLQLGHDCMDEALDGALLLTILVYLLVFLRYLCERQGKENNSDPK